MRFFVEVSLKEAPTPEVLELLPVEVEHGKMFDESGVREALYVSAEAVKAWQIYRAESREEVERIVASFPLTRFCDVTISELRAE